MASKDIPRYYFDWAATSKRDIINQISTFANPSSRHSEGRLAKQELEDARNRCAQIFGVKPDTVYFTSGGTESNSIALLANLIKNNQGRVLSSRAEHASVRNAIDTLDKTGRPVGKIAVDISGAVTPFTLEKALRQYDGIRFLSIMAVNNETGAVSDMEGLRDLIRSKDGVPVHWHCDLVQAVGKIPVDIRRWDIDSASVSAHKFGGPRGIGLLYLRRPQEVLYKGGGQENNVRGGTVNVEGASALAQCLECHVSDNRLNNEYGSAKIRMKNLITALCEIQRCKIIPSLRVDNQDGYSPYILQAAFKGIPGEVMARALDDLGFAVSTGSACSSSSNERPVLQAMGIDENTSLEGIRISQGYTTSDTEIQLLIGAIHEVLKFL
jgi:cysteine desulfurase